jgi:threonine/homoserine/homoserine lactone efflux protein
LTHAMARQLDANPRASLWLSRLAGLCLIGFALRLFWVAA